ncbi:MAG: response regulator transcription factor [Flavobacteriales bacterium]|nr:response regulator transcription factor [Flavobacteriales bacterium]
MNITAIIIDDERLARKELTSLLEAHKKIEIIDEAANADEALVKIHEKRPNLIFLDIQMPGKTGFDLLEELDYIPEVIFTTAYDEYALKAFEVNALDYLLKPIEEERLRDAIDKVVEKIELDDEPASQGEVLTENDQVFVKDGDKCWFVTLKDIRYFESVGNYVKVHFDTNRPMILKSLNNLEKKLDTKTFFRANRKHIINLRWIEKSETWFNGGLLVTVNGEETIEISRRQAAKLKDMMSL